MAGTRKQMAPWTWAGVSVVLLMILVVAGSVNGDDFESWSLIPVAVDEFVEATKTITEICHQQRLILRDCEWYQIKFHKVVGRGLKLFPSASDQKKADQLLAQVQVHARRVSPMMTASKSRADTKAVLQHATLQLVSFCFTNLSVCQVPYILNRLDANFLARAYRG
eukprot:scpid84226/ scgid30029/ 